MCIFPSKNMCQDYYNFKMIVLRSFHGGSTSYGKQEVIRSFIRLSFRIKAVSRNMPLSNTDCSPKIVRERKNKDDLLYGRE